MALMCESLSVRILMSIKLCLILLVINILSTSSDENNYSVCEFILVDVDKCTKFDNFDIPGRKLGPWCPDEDDIYGKGPGPGAAAGANCDTPNGQCMMSHKK